MAKQKETTATWSGKGKAERSVRKHKNGAPSTPRLRAVIHPAEEGGFWAEVPALRGCYTEGETLAETVTNLQDAIAGWLEVAEASHPPEEDSQAVVVEFPL
jgi:predicted RNase H-like HicB family nuclease